GVPAVEAALVTTAAWNMGFRGHMIAGLYGRDLRSNGDNGSGELVAEPKRRPIGAGRPRVPFVDVQIGAANRSRGDLDEHIGALRLAQADGPEGEGAAAGPVLEDEA